MSSQKLIVIGLAGATCAGKTTLSQLLCNLFGTKAKKLHQDDFYHPDEYKGHVFLPELNHVNWEIETAFDNEKLAKTVKDFLNVVRPRNGLSSNKAEKGQHHLRRILEALEKEVTSESLLKSNSEVSSSCQKLFEKALEDGLFLPHGLLVVEGIHVLTNPKLADLFDLKLFVTLDHKTCAARRALRNYEPPDPPGYFEKIVWPSYVEQESPLKADQVTFLDGSLPINHNFSLVLQSLLRQSLD